MNPTYIRVPHMAGGVNDFMHSKILRHKGQIWQVYLLTSIYNILYNKGVNFYILSRRYIIKIIIIYLKK